jgi:hypothetical protein
MPVISVLRRQRQVDHEIKVILGSIVSSRPACDTQQVPVSKTKQNKTKTCLQTRKITFQLLNISKKKIKIYMSITDVLVFINPILFLHSLVLVF